MEGIMIADYENLKAGRKYKFQKEKFQKLFRMGVMRPVVKLTANTGVHVPISEEEE